MTQTCLVNLQEPLANLRCAGLPRASFRQDAWEQVAKHRRLSPDDLRRTRRTWDESEFVQQVGAIRKQIKNVAFNLDASGACESVSGSQHITARPLPSPPKPPQRRSSPKPHAKDKHRRRSRTPRGRNVTAAPVLPPPSPPQGCAAPAGGPKSGEPRRVQESAVSKAVPSPTQPLPPPQAKAMPRPKSCPKIRSGWRVPSPSRAPAAQSKVGTSDCVPGN